MNEVKKSLAPKIRRSGEPLATGTFPHFGILFLASGLLLAAVLLFPSVSAAQAPLLSYRLEAVSLDGEPIQTVPVGSQFQLRVWVQDVRATPEGVVSAYLDVRYDSQLVSLLSNSLVFGDRFGEVVRGDTSTAGVMDEVGSFARGYLNPNPLPDPLGGDAHLLFQATFLANAIGEAEFTSDGADNIPLHATTLLGLDDRVTDAQTEFGTATIEIVPEPTGVPILLGLLVVGCRWISNCRRRLRVSCNC